MINSDKLYLTPVRRRKKIKIDSKLLIRYNHLAEIEESLSTEELSEEVEIEYFDIIDTISGQYVNIFDTNKLSHEDQKKFDTLVYMVYKYRTEDFRYRIARHETELSFADEITLIEDQYITEATKLLSDLIKMLEMRDNDFKNVSVIFKVNDLENPTGKKLLSNEDKRVEFKEDIYAKYIIHSSIRHLLSFLSLMTNFYIDSFFYYCRDADTITIDEIIYELEKIPKKAKTRKKRHEVSPIRMYMGFMIEFIQYYIREQDITQQNKSINVQKIRECCFHILSKFGFIPLDIIYGLFNESDINSLNHNKITDYIRKITPSAITDLGKIQVVEIWDIAGFLNSKPTSLEMAKRYPSFDIKLNEYSKLRGYNLSVTFDDKNDIVIRVNK